MSEVLRVGRVASIDKEAGTARICYTDKNREGTFDIPIATMGEEYRMPPVGKMVLVAHVSDGSEGAVILGTYWSSSDPPKDPSSDYRKDFDDTEEVYEAIHDEGKYLKHVKSMRYETNESETPSPHYFALNEHENHEFHMKGEHILFITDSGSYIYMDPAGAISIYAPAGVTVKGNVSIDGDVYVSGHIYGEADCALKAHEVGHIEPPSVEMPVFDEDYEG